MLQDNLQQGTSQPVMTKHEYIQAVETKIERRNWSKLLVATYSPKHFHVMELKIIPPLHPYASTPKRATWQKVKKVALSNQ